jgi:hypothetical protein
MTVDGPQSQSGSLGEEINLLALPGIKPRCHGHTCHSTVTKRRVSGRKSLCKLYAFFHHTVMLTHKNLGVLHTTYHAAKFVVNILLIKLFYPNFPKL